MASQSGDNSPSTATSSSGSLFGATVPNNQATPQTLFGSGHNTSSISTASQNQQPRFGGSPFGGAPRNQTTTHPPTSTSPLFGPGPNPPSYGGTFGSSTPQNTLSLSVPSASGSGGLFASQAPTASQTSASTFRGFGFSPRAQSQRTPLTVSSVTGLLGLQNIPNQTTPQTAGSTTSRTTSSPQSQANPQTSTMSDEEVAAIFCFEGDLEILATYNGKRVVGKVSSTAMCAASKVFKKFIFPPFGPSLVKRADNDTEEASSSENLGDEPRRLDLQEDDGEALLVLLRIIHLQFHKVPRTLPFRQLLNLSILLDLYENIELVSPWVSNWLTNEESEADKIEREEWLFISWVFGRSEIFNKLANKLVKKAYDSNKVPTADYSGRNLLEVHTPLGISESILQCHQKQLQALINIPYDLAESYHPPTNFGKSTRTLCRFQQAECDAVTYGSLLLGLIKIGLWPRKSPEQIFLLDNTLVAYFLSELKILQQPLTKDADGRTYNHDACLSVNIKNAVDEVLQQDFNPVLDSHTLHMNTQKKRLGLLN